MYTGENDAMRLEHGDGLDLDPTVLTGMLSKLSINPSSADFINPSPPPGVVHAALLGPGHEVTAAERVAHARRY
jgi:hypothetical protein